MFFLLLIEFIPFIGIIQYDIITIKYKNRVTLYYHYYVLLNGSFFIKIIVIRREVNIISSLFICV